eukprot:scaffold137401_cov31-Tisochrysis_lutea.AAC.4
MAEPTGSSQVTMETEKSASKIMRNISNNTSCKKIRTLLCSLSKAATEAVMSRCSLYDCSTTATKRS